MNKNKVLEHAISSMSGASSSENQGVIIPGYDIKFPDNIRFDYEVINGIRYPRVAWRDIVSLYPDHWILYTNYEILKDDREFKCTLLEVCDNKHKSEERIRLLKEGYRVTALRTKDCMTVGVIS